MRGAQGQAGQGPDEDESENEEAARERRRAFTMRAIDRLRGIVRPTEEQRAAWMVKAAEEARRMATIAAKPHVPTPKTPRYFTGKYKLSDLGRSYKS